MSKPAVLYSFSELFSPCPCCKIVSDCFYISKKLGEKICFKCWIGEGNKIPIVYG